MPSLNDTYLSYQFIKKFASPFDKWPAFAAGIIDADGNILKKRNERTPGDDKLFGNYDQIICNLKKLVAKIPGGKSRLGLLAATALLLKESEALTLDNVQEKFESEYLKVADINLIEETGTGGLSAGGVPANNEGSGHIAGTKEAGDDPPVGKKAWDKYKRKNKKFGEMAFARRKGANDE